MELAGKHPRIGEFYRALGDFVGRQPVEPAAGRIAPGDLRAAVGCRGYFARPGTRTHHPNSATDAWSSIGSVGRGGKTWPQAHDFAVQDAAAGNFPHRLSALGSHAGLPPSTSPSSCRASAVSRSAGRSNLCPIVGRLAVATATRLATLRLKL